MRPRRYAKQLVSHLGRHEGGECSEESDQDWTRFPFGHVELRTTEGRFVVCVQGEAENLDRVAHVLGERLIRLVADDSLTVAWRRERWA